MSTGAASFQQNIRKLDAAVLGAHMHRALRLQRRRDHWMRCAREEREPKFRSSMAQWAREANREVVISIRSAYRLVAAIRGGEN